MSGDSSMSDFVTALTGTNGLTGEALWGTVSSLIPVIVGVATFALGFYLVRKLVKGMSKGKFKV